MDSSKTSIVFRVDESDSIGRGHVSRCLSLCEMLYSPDSVVCFWSKNLGAQTVDYLNSLGVRVRIFADEKDFFSLDLSQHILIVDGYQFGPSFWNNPSIRRAKLSVFIDDWRDAYYTANIVVCGNEGVEFKPSSGSRGTEFFVGGRYNFLKKEFRSLIGSSQKPRSSKAIVLALGGTNQIELTKSLVNRLVSEFLDQNIWVISGSNEFNLTLLKNEFAQYPKLRFFKLLTPSQLIWVYKRAICLIVPASTMLLEAFSIGCPIVSGWFVNNQANSLASYEKKGLLSNVGDMRVISGNQLCQAVRSAVLVGEQMAERQRNYVLETRAGTRELITRIISS